MLLFTRRFVPVLSLCSALLALTSAHAAPKMTKGGHSASSAHTVAADKTIARAFRNIRGQVVTVSPATKANPQAAVSIAHEAIPNFMEAMTMTMPLKTASDAKRLKKGGKIRFDLVLRGGTYTVENIKSLPANTKLKIAKS